MKTIGLLGGMSWESTTLYYRLLNEGIRLQLGGLHSAKIAMVSVDFHEIEQIQASNDWHQVGETLAISAGRIEAAGADFLLICTNTMHKVITQIENALTIPVLHLADATAEAIKAEKKRTVGLIGTHFTMQEDFYRGRLIEKHNLDVLIPSDKDMEIVHNVIFQELCKGTIRKESRREYLRIIDNLQSQGAEGIILGCTEICLLIQQENTPVPLYNTTEIHTEAAIRYALSPE
jgi:aspartate racemase